jgi:sarcosine oxidase
VKEAGAEVERLEAGALGERFPQHRLLPDDVGYLDPAGGVLRTEMAVIGAVERAERAGATVHPGTSITSVDAQGRRVVLESARERWSYDDVVICAGAWSRPLLAGGIGHLVKPLRICLTWYAARRPEAFQAERFPAFVRHSGGVHLYGTPTFDGSLVKAAGVIASVPIDSLDDFERDVSPEDRDRTSEAVRRFLPGLHPTCVRSDAYLDLCTEDGRPIVGPDPERRGVYVATGFSGKGFKMSTGVAEAVAEELTTGKRPTRLAVAAPHRLRWGR